MPLPMLVIGLAVTLAVLVLFIWWLVRVLFYWIPVFITGFYLGLALYIVKHPKSFTVEVEKAAALEREILAALRGEVQ